mmetsp:Transcript_15206/g.18813  ORF Transcript_15206/g.18813 Transcript_15206/m.18813 type:complete len:211 (+) Transcript_15206:1200-1832(+)
MHKQHNLTNNPTFASGIGALENFKTQLIPMFPFGKGGLFTSFIKLGTIYICSLSSLLGHSLIRRQFFKRSNMKFMSSLPQIYSSKSREANPSAKSLLNSSFKPNLSIASLSYDNNLLLVDTRFLTELYNQSGLNTKASFKYSVQLRLKMKPSSWKKANIVSNSCGDTICSFCAVSTALVIVIIGLLILLLSISSRHCTHFNFTICFIWSR